MKHGGFKHIVALDEGRFSLITWCRRRWDPLGKRPPWRVQDEDEWVWLDAAVEPNSGTGIFLLLPTLEGQCLQIFLEHLRHEMGGGAIGVVLDRSGRHRSLQVNWPQGMHPLPLPPYSPEVNPAEQILSSAQAALKRRFHHARRVAKRPHQRTAALLEASFGAASTHWLSLLDRGGQFSRIIFSLKEYYLLLGKVVTRNHFSQLCCVPYEHRENLVCETGRMA